MSAPSVTAMPMASPARHTRIHRAFDDVSQSAANAKKQSPTVMEWVPTPQQAAEKKLELRLAAIAPSTQARGLRDILRKHVHAPSPRKSTASGGKNLENCSGPSTYISP